MKPTLDQAGKLIELVSQSGRTGEWVQEHLVGSGAFSDLLEVNNLKDKDRNERRRFFDLKPLNPPLLEPVDTVIIPALAGCFSARKKFVLNYGGKAKPGVLIAYLGDNFRSRCGDAVEEPAAEATLSYARLTRSEFDGPILASLGNRSDLAVFLRQIYWLIERQPNGESGTLLTNGWANIFYMPGLLRAVHVDWRARGVGWGVGAGSVSGPDGWCDGDQVFFRNS